MTFIQFVTLKQFSDSFQENGPDRPGRKRRRDRRENYRRRWERDRRDDDYGWAYHYSPAALRHDRGQRNSPAKVVYEQKMDRGGIFQNYAELWVVFSAQNSKKDLLLDTFNMW